MDPFEIERTYTILKTADLVSLSLFISDHVKYNSHTP